MMRRIERIAFVLCTGFGHENAFQAGIIAHAAEFMLNSQSGVRR
jgi:hypothetical protein